MRVKKNNLSWQCLAALTDSAGFNVMESSLPSIGGGERDRERASKYRSMKIGEF